jgi:hypothetical protein
MPTSPAEALYPAGPSNKLGNEPPEDTVEGDTSANHFNEAMKDLKMNEQEQFLYQMHLKNLHGNSGVDHPPNRENPEGARSSLMQTTVTFGDRTYNIPTVWGGKILPVKDAIEQARKEGLDKFPSYSTREEAESRYNKMHGYMEKDTKDYLRNKRQYDFTAFDDPEAQPDVAFMRAGKVPKVGEVSSGPSANIEDRTKPGKFPNKDRMLDTSAFGGELSEKLGYSDVGKKPAPPKFIEPKKRRK